MTGNWRLRKNQLTNTTPGTKLLIRNFSGDGYYAAIHIEKLVNKMGDGLYYHLVEIQDPKGNWTTERNSFEYLDDYKNGEDRWSFHAMNPGGEYIPHWRDNPLDVLMTDVIKDAAAKLSFVIGQNRDPIVVNLLKQARELIRKAQK